MKKKYNFSVKINGKILMTLCFALGVLLFQGQNNVISPEIDHWQIPGYTMQRQSYTPPQTYTVVTDATGFDNFDMGIDNAESSIAVNPRNPLWFANGWNGVGFVAATHHTENGYDPWLINNPALPSTAGDPWMVYDSLGNLYYINLNGPVNGTWVVKSTNNGLTWGAAIAGCTGNDRENISADQTAGPYANFVYCGETTSGGASFYRSTDNGASFSFITTLGPHNLPGFMCTVGPNGTTQGGSVYVVTYSGSNAAGTYNFHRSINGGASFTAMSSISGIGIIGIEIGGRSTINGIRTRPYPMIAADNSYGPYRGRFYVVYANNPGGVNGLHPDVYSRYSTDFGSTWSAPVTVNDNPAATDDDWFPAIWCDKDDNGKLYVKWYSDKDNPATFSTAVYAAFSTTGGTTFTASTKISTANFPYPNVGPCSGCVTNYRGDYDGIVGNGKTSMSAWFDGRNATWGSYSAYFPDFALTVLPNSHGISGINDSDFSYCRVPAVKLYTDKVKFTATVTPPPGAGTIAISFLNKSAYVLQDSLTTYPDSLRVRIKCTGGVTNGNYIVAISGKGSNGTPVHIRNIALSVVTSITNTNSEVPDKFYLSQNYPNPFNPKTNINFALPKSSHVLLKVYNSAGSEVAVLVNESMAAGIYKFDWDAINFASGIYFYKIETSDFIATKKMILIK